MEKIGFDHRTPSGRALVIEVNVAEKLVETIEKVNELVEAFNKLKHEYRKEIFKKED